MSNVRWFRHSDGTVIRCPPREVPNTGDWSAWREVADSTGTPLPAPHPDPLPLAEQIGPGSERTSRKQQVADAKELVAKRHPPQQMAEQPGEQELKVGCTVECVSKHFCVDINVNGPPKPNSARELADAARLPYVDQVHEIIGQEIQQNGEMKTQIRNLESKLKAAEQAVRDREAMAARLRELCKSTTGCNFIHCDKPKNWTCLDDKQQASSGMGNYSPSWRAVLASGETMCRNCKIREILDAVPAAQSGEGKTQ